MRAPGAAYAPEKPPPRKEARSEGDGKQSRAAMDLMRAIKANGFDPTPPLQNDFFLREGEAPEQRGLAWLRSKTIRLGRMSPFAVDEHGNELGIRDLARDLGMARVTRDGEEDLGFAYRTWRSLESKGFGKKEGKRLYIRGDVPQSDPNTKANKKRKVDCALHPKNPNYKKLNTLDPQSRAARRAQLQREIELENEVMREADRVIRNIFRQRNHSIERGFGIDKSAGKNRRPESALDAILRPAIEQCVDVVERQHGVDCAVPESGSAQSGASFKGLETPRSSAREVLEVGSISIKEHVGLLVPENQRTNAPRKAIPKTPKPKSSASKYYTDDRNPSIPDADYQPMAEFMNQFGDTVGRLAHAGEIESAVVALRPASIEDLTSYVKARLEKGRRNGFRIIGYKLIVDFCAECAVKAERQLKEAGRQQEERHQWALAHPQEEAEQVEREAAEERSRLEREDKARRIQICAQCETSGLTGDALAVTLKFCSCSFGQAAAQRNGPDFIPTEIATAARSASLQQRLVAYLRPRKKGLSAEVLANCEIVPHEDRVEAHISKFERDWVSVVKLENGLLQATLDELGDKRRAIVVRPEHAPPRECAA